MTTRELPVPAGVLEALSPYGPVLHADDPAPAADAIYHLPSPFEPSGIDYLWPPERRDGLLVVTLHDLIPAIFPAEQMPDPGVRRAYWARTELVRQADWVLNVSEATAQDAVRLLGVPESKLAVTGGGVSDDFRPPESRSAALAALRELRPGIGDEFVLYTGGMDYRKNVGGLLRAYAGLPRALRERYDLVLVGRLGADHPRGLFGERAEALGIADRIVFTGFVSDEELVAALPGVQPLRAPLALRGLRPPRRRGPRVRRAGLMGRNSSLVELVDREEAFFDAADPSSIQAALERALADADLLGRLRAPAIRRAVHVAQDRRADRSGLRGGRIVPPRPRLRRKRVLSVGSLGLASADAERALRVLEALATSCEVDVLVHDAGERESLAPPLSAVSVTALGRAELLRGGYDETIYWLGASGDDAFPLALLQLGPDRGRPRPRLAGVYAWPQPSARSSSLGGSAISCARCIPGSGRMGPSYSTTTNWGGKASTWLGRRSAIRGGSSSTIPRTRRSRGSRQSRAMRPRSSRSGLTSTAEAVAERLYSAITEPRLRSRR